ncbi:MAG: acyl transferase [Bacteroidota bacterium]
MGLNTSRHYVRDENFYFKNCEKIFNRFYGPLLDYHTLFLLPGYIERGNSSLVSMAQYFIDRTESKHSGFYLSNHSALLKIIEKIKNEKGTRKILLCGVSFALMDLAESYDIDLGNDVIVMETGGMKGRRREIVREELHSFLCRKLNVSKIHSEYGMTELSSQAYSTGDGKFRTPPWMRVLLRDTNDPFDVGDKKSGAINVIDLANISSCSFIETQDLGRLNSSGELEILGRFDNSDVRGCNLMV